MLPSDRHQQRYTIFNYFRNYDLKNYEANNCFPLDIEKGISLGSIAHSKLKIKPLEYMPKSFSLLYYINNTNPIPKEEYDFKRTYLNCTESYYTYPVSNNKTPENINTILLNKNKISTLPMINIIYKHSDYNNDKFNNMPDIHNDEISFLNEYKYIDDTKLTDSNSYKITVSGIHHYKTDSTNIIHMTHQYITKKPYIYFQADVCGITQMKLYDYYTINDSTNIIDNNNISETTLTILYDYYKNNPQKYIQTLKRKIDGTNINNLQQLYNDSTIIIDNTSYVKHEIELREHIFDINSTNINVVEYISNNIYTKPTIKRPINRYLYFGNKINELNNPIIEYKLLTNDYNISIILNDNTTMCNETLYTLWFEVEQQTNLTEKRQILIDKISNTMTQQFRTESDMPVRFADFHTKVEH